MATRLTAFSKLLITLLILGLIFAAGWYVLDKTSLGQQLQDQTEREASRDEEKTVGSDKGSTTSGQSGTTAGVVEGDDVLNVQLVSWGGYAPGLYFNEGAVANTRSRFYKDYGFKVNFTR